MSALGELTTTELACGETESLRIGDHVEVTVLEIDGESVVLRLDGVEESQVAAVTAMLSS